jgi:hypothetical protein
MSLHSSKQQVDIALESVCCKICFKCFRSVLQVLHIDVTKVDRDVAHVAIWLYTYVSSVGSKCFICFRHMLQIFYLDIAKVDLDFAYICKCFKCFHTYVVSGFI